MFNKKSKTKNENTDTLNGSVYYSSSNSNIYNTYDSSSNIEVHDVSPINPTSQTKTKKQKVVIDFKNTPRSEVDPDLLTTPQKCEYYVPKFSQSRFWLIVILSTVGFIGVGIAYQLNILLTAFICLIAFFASQKTILHICRSSYEEEKVEDVGTYVEQMLYSFRRNGKILTSLQDASTVFPEGEMKEVLEKAINHITQAQTTGNIYEEALQFVQERFDCRRVRSLHRFLVKVEGVGGDNEIGVQALLSDRRLWLARIDDFKKEKKLTRLDIVVACLFSSAICAATMYMLPSYVGAAKHIIARAFSTIYILINIFTINGTLKNTIYYLNDLYTPEEELYLLNKFRWLKTWDKKAERKKGLKPALIIVAMGLVTPLIKKSFWWVSIVFLIFGLFMWLIQPLLRHNSTIKSITKEIEKAYPDWLLELSLLLQTDNLHVALEKTMDTAPLLLKDDLTELGDKIAANPTDVAPFNEFLNMLKLPSIHSSMRLLFSIANYGSEDETRQISELIERNALLMNKAEEQKNKDRMAKVTIFKFVPMGASAMKLIVDMAVFLIVFISQSLSSVSF